MIIDLYESGRGKLIAPYLSLEGFRSSMEEVDNAINRGNYRTANKIMYRLRRCIFVSDLPVGLSDEDLARLGSLRKKLKVMRSHE